MGLLTRDKSAPMPVVGPDSLRKATWDVHREAQLRDLRWRLARYGGNRDIRESVERQIRAYEDPEPPDQWNVTHIDGAVTNHSPRPRKDARGRELRRLAPEEFYPAGYGLAPETPVGDDVVWVPA